MVSVISQVCTAAAVGVPLAGRIASAVHREDGDLDSTIRPPATLTEKTGTSMKKIPLGLKALVMTVVLGVTMQGARMTITRNEVHQCSGACNVFPHCVLVQLNTRRWIVSASSQHALEILLLMFTERRLPFGRSYSESEAKKSEY